MGRILGTDPAIPLDQFLQAGKFLQGVPCHRKERTGYFLPKPRSKTHRLAKRFPLSTVET